MGWAKRAREKMEDGNGGVPKAEDAQESQGPQPIKLTITLLPDGRLNVEGPINDQLFSFGLLEMAKDAIRDHVARLKAQAAARAIVPAGMIPPGVRLIPQRRM